MPVGPHVIYTGKGQESSLQGHKRIKPYIKSHHNLDLNGVNSVEQGYTYILFHETEVLVLAVCNIMIGSKIFHMTNN